MAAKGWIRTMNNTHTSIQQQMTQMSLIISRTRRKKWVFESIGSRPRNWSSRSIKSIVRRWSRVESTDQWKVESMDWIDRASL